MSPLYFLTQSEIIPIPLPWLTLSFLVVAKSGFSESIDSDILFLQVITI